MKTIENKTQNTIKIDLQIRNAKCNKIKLIEPNSSIQISDEVDIIVIKQPNP